MSVSCWLIVGLGNPGPTYAATRHNVGQMVVEELARRVRASFSAPRGMRAEVAESRVSAAGFGALGVAEKVALIKSRTYMNDSGAPVGKLAAWYKSEPAHVVAIHDELDLELGQLRVKFGGGDNGHNGLKSIRAALGTGEFYRVRFGIGRPPGRQAPADFVLNNFPPAQRTELELEVGRAADAVECLLTDGLGAAQNGYNS